MNGPTIRPVFFVYVDCRRDDGRPFYVGKGSASRVRLGRRNPKHRAIGKSVGWKRIVVSATIDEHEAFRLEQDLISLLLTRHEFGGANFTDGGEGAAGRRLSEEQRAAISRRNHGRNVGRRHSPEAIEKIRTANRGRPVSDSQRQKIAKAHLGERFSDERRAKIAAKARGRRHTDEWRRSMSLQMRGRTFSENHRARIAHALKGRRPSLQCLAAANKARRSLSEEAREKIRASSQGRHHCPESIEKCRIAAQAREAKRYLEVDEQ